MRLRFLCSAVGLLAGVGVVNGACEPYSCGAYADCIDQGTTSTCICHIGYEHVSDNPFTCEGGCAVNWCGANSYCDQQATPSTCICQDGFFQFFDDPFACEEGCFIFPCGANADCDYEATPSTCECQDGFVQVSDNPFTCEEGGCELYPCGDNADCIDGGTTYTCECQDGFVPVSDNPFTCEEAAPGDPYYGIAAPVPGIIQAEYFDYGGQGVAYNEEGGVNDGQTFRTSEAVGIGDLEVGRFVGWTFGDEWLRYTVEVEYDVARFDFRFVVAKFPNDWSFRIVADVEDDENPCTSTSYGTDLSGLVTNADYGDDDSVNVYKSIDIMTSTRGVGGLPAGRSKIWLCFEEAIGNIGIDSFELIQGAVCDPSPCGANTDCIDGDTTYTCECQDGFVPVSDNPFTCEESPPGGPYGETAAPVPGIIQAEHFDYGGQGVAYNEEEEGGANAAQTFRTSEAVGIADRNGGRVVGWVFGGEWLRYTVEVEYDVARFDFRFVVTQFSNDWSFRVVANVDDDENPCTSTSYGTDLSGLVTNADYGDDNSGNVYKSINIMTSTRDGVGGLPAGRSEIWLCFEEAIGNVNIDSFELIQGEVCDPSPCGDNADCTDGDKTYTCACQDGFVQVSDNPVVCEERCNPSEDNSCEAGMECCPEELVCRDPLTYAANACGDPHMTGFHGQKFDFTGEDGAWYCMLSDQGSMHLNMRVTAPVPGRAEITYITGLSIMTTDYTGLEHNIVITVKDPHSLLSACPTSSDGSAYPCLADGALRIVLDGHEGKLLQPGTVVLGPGTTIDAVNLPGACRSFGFEHYWERKKLDYAQAGRKLANSQSMGEWVVGDPTVTNMAECEEYVSRAVADGGSLGLFNHQSEHASFRIVTPTATIRLSHGRLHQTATRDPSDSFDLPDHLTWQMNVAIDQNDVSLEAKGVLGETIVPRHDAAGDVIMEGMDAIRGEEQEYRVAGPLEIGFAQGMDQQ